MPTSRTRTSAAARLTRWYALSVLTLVYSLNIADRFVASTVLEPIRLDLHLTDAQIAFITGVALALFYVTLGIPIATFADRANRRNIVAAAVGAWSLMTALCGLAHTAMQFALARLGVGVGEAGGTPPSTSMLADEFSPSDRPMAFTIFALGAPIGAWLGSELAGWLADHYGWRATFFALGVPGIIVAALVRASVREPARGQNDGQPCEPAGLADTLRFLTMQRSAVHLIAGATVATLWGWGLMWWTPTFLMRVHGMSVGQAAATLGRMHLLAGSIATLATSVAVRPAVARDPRRVLWLQAGVLGLIAIPSLLAYVTGERATAVAMLWTIVPAVYFFIGPTLGLLQNVLPPSMRAQTVAVLLFTANVANLIIAPQVIGIASDVLAPHVGGNGSALRLALIALAPTSLWAAYHYWAAARSVVADQRRIERGAMGNDSPGIAA